MTSLVVPADRNHPWFVLSLTLLFPLLLMSLYYSRENPLFTFTIIVADQLHHHHHHHHHVWFGDSYFHIDTSRLLIS